MISALDSDREGPKPRDFGPCDSGIKIVVGLRCARSDNLAGQLAALTSVLVRHAAVHDRVLDSLSRHHKPPPATRQVMPHRRATRRIYRVVIEDGDIRLPPLLELPALADAEKVRRLRSDSLD